MVIYAAWECAQFSNPMFIMLIIAMLFLTIHFGIKGKLHDHKNDTQKVLEANDDNGLYLK